MVQAEKVENTSRDGVLGRHQLCSKERILVLSNTIERNFSLGHTPSLLYPEAYHDGNWRNHIRERKCVTSISFKDNWMKELGSEVAGGGEDLQQTQPKTKNPFVEQESC